MKTRWNNSMMRWERIEYYPSRFTGMALIRILSYWYPTRPDQVPK